MCLLNFLSNASCLEGLAIITLHVLFPTARHGKDYPNVNLKDGSGFSLPAPIWLLGSICMTRV